MTTSSSATAERAATVELIGGRLCLDFVNSMDGLRGEREEELLLTYTDLVEWARHAGALATKDAARLLALGAQHPQDAAAALRRSRMLREALNRVFAAGIAGRTADHADLEIVNGALAEAMAHARLEPVGNGYTWAWATDGAGLDVMLWPVVRSAADLLTSTDLERVRTCDSERCGWIFLDTSRNHSRRWCSMNDCGNRAKARRHYQRRRPTVLPTD